MNKYEILSEKFKKQQKVVGTSMVIFNNSVILEKMAKRDDLDFILFDAEHGIFDAQNITNLLQTMRLLGVPSIVRAQDAEYYLVAKLVDMGADGIMIPRTETLEQIKTAIDGLHFSPIGRKGMGGQGQMRVGEKFADFSKTRFLLPQIESPKGIKNLPSMLEKYGEYINAVIVGPYDMSVMVGTPCDIQSPEMTNAIQQVFDICKKYNKSCGIFCDDEVLAAKYRKMGANVLWMATDRDYFLRGYNTFLDGVKDL
jgi:2-keto-3-deoxy-L-rhamnonate aldolase RhmA